MISVPSPGTDLVFGTTWFLRWSCWSHLSSSICKTFPLTSSDFFQDFSFIFGFLWFEFEMPRCRGIFVCFLVWCSLSFLNLWFDINLGKFVVIVVSNISFRFLVFPLYLCNTFSVRFSQSCPTPCDPMNCSTPGFPVHHPLLEFTQTHVHRVGDAIQPSHPLLSPFPPAFNLSQHQGLLWSRKWQPTPVFLPGKLHKQRSLAGYSPWGRKELYMTERTRTNTFYSCLTTLVYCFAFFFFSSFLFLFAFPFWNFLLIAS